MAYEDRYNEFEQYLAAGEPGVVCVVRWNMTRMRFAQMVFQIRISHIPLMSLLLQYPEKGPTLLTTLSATKLPQIRPTLLKKATKLPQIRPTLLKKATKLPQIRPTLLKKATKLSQI